MFALWRHSGNRRAPAALLAFVLSISLSGNGILHAQDLGPPPDVPALPPAPALQNPAPAQPAQPAPAPPAAEGSSPPQAESSAPAEPQGPPPASGDESLVPDDRLPPPTPRTAVVRQKLAQANVQTAALLAQLGALDTQIFEINQSILEGERRAAELGAQLHLSDGDVARLELRRQEIRASWNDQARRIYKYSPGSIWAPLFLSRTWSDWGRLKKVWQAIVDGQARLIAQSAHLKQELLTHKGDLVDASQKLVRQTIQLNASRDKLREARQTRTTALGQLRLSIGQAMAAERAVLAIDGGGMRIPHLCSPGSPVQDRKLADLLDWYAPAAAAEPFLPPKFTSSGIVWSGQASWYGPRFEGCRASSGATFRPNQMTAASLSLPFGTFLKVSAAGKSVVVVITDRGPYVRGRELDLSHAAAQAIGLGGVGQVAMEVLLPAEPSPPFP